MAGADPAPVEVELEQDREHARRRPPKHRSDVPGLLHRSRRRVDSLDRCAHEASVVLVTCRAVAHDDAAGRGGLIIAKLNLRANG